MPRPLRFLFRLFLYLLTFGAVALIVLGVADSAGHLREFGPMLRNPIGFVRRAFEAEFGPLLCAIGGAVAGGWMIVGWLGGAFSRWGRVERRPNKLICHQCGYDLRATPARCPECGSEPEPR